PVGGVDVEGTRVDRQRLGREVVDDARIAERVQTHPDLGRAWADVAAEDLADADLRGALRLVLEADEPERDHAPRVVARPGPHLEPPVPRRIEARGGLLLAHDRFGVEPVLAHDAPERTGEDAGLERGDAQAAVELGTPRRLIRLHEQAE